MVSKRWKRQIRSSIKWLNRQFRLFTSPFRTLPSFIIIGAQKSGTSTLYHTLKAHPDIYMSFDKESKFFDRYYSKGVAWYRHQFPLRFLKRKCVGDNTPYYLFHPLVSERVHEMLPDVKLILILRNPVDRAYSQYQMERRKGREKHETFEDAIKNEENRIQKSRKELIQTPLEYHHVFENTSYLTRGKYIEQIRHWLEHFSREQLLILPAEWFHQNTKEGIQKVCDFLAVKTYTPCDIEAYNVASYPEMGEDTRKKLEAYYKPFNAELEAFLGQKTGW